MKKLQFEYYTEKDLIDVGFKNIGHSINIHPSVTITYPENISLGNNIRIDGYTTLSAGKNGFIDIGSNVHIGSNSVLIGSDGIIIEDYVAISHGVKIFSVTDTNGGFFSVPELPDNLKYQIKGLVSIKKFAGIGSGVVILPGLVIEEGAAIGPLSLINKNCKEWTVYWGESPAKPLYARRKKIELHVLI